MKNNISKIINTLIFTLILILGMNFLTSKNEKLFEILGYKSYVVLSGSMEPEFYPGDIVVIKHKNKSKIGLNDVVTFVDDEGVVITHRIVEKLENGYITKGDNNNVEDAGILIEENIIGEVKFSIPRLGYIVNLLSNPITMSIGLVILGLYIFYCYKD